MSMAFILAGIGTAALCVVTALRQLISRDYRARHPRRPLVWIILSVACFSGALATTGPEAGASVSDAECRADLACWGDKHALAAAIRCAPAIEDLAHYRADWTDGVMTPKFTLYAWADRAAGTVTYTGDRITFENGFGAAENMIYACTYDPETDTVTAAAANPGRL